MLSPQKNESEPEKRGEALSIDQVIKELESMKASGLVEGHEKVEIGLNFDMGGVELRSLVLFQDEKGSMAVSLSEKSEKEWKASQSSMRAVSPEQTHGLSDHKKVEMARDLGWDDRAARMERRMLEERSEKGAPKSTAVRKGI